MGIQAAEQAEKDERFDCPMKTYKGKIKKKIAIKLVGDAEKAFKGLNRIVGEQRNKGITKAQKR